MKKRILSNKNKNEKGGAELMEFALGIPIFLVLMIGIFGVCILFWVNAISARASIAGSRAAGLSRGNNTVIPATGYSEFTTFAEGIGSSGARGLIGSPSLEWQPKQFMVRIAATGGTNWNIGSLIQGYLDFKGGGASRIHIFNPGPPEGGEWE